jgi:hypothetical protein
VWHDDEQFHKLYRHGALSSNFQTNHTKKGNCEQGNQAEQEGEDRGDGRVSIFLYALSHIILTPANRLLVTMQI